MMQLFMVVSFRSAVPWIVVTNHNPLYCTTSTGYCKDIPFAGGANILNVTAGMLTLC